MTRVYVVLHAKLPTDSMHLHNRPYSEPIETVNVEIVGIYKSEASAQAAARAYFFDTLGYSDNGESENGGYYQDAVDIPDSDCGTWDEEVYVEDMPLK